MKCPDCGAAMTEKGPFPFGKNSDCGVLYKICPVCMKRINEIVNLKGERDADNESGG